MFKPERLIKYNAKPSDMDSVKVRQSKLNSKHKDVELLHRCEAVWNNMDEFRQQRARGIRFAYGDQWGDMITVNGKTTTYRKYLMDKGNVVIQNNLIKNKVETIVGNMVRERMEPVCHAIDREEQQYGEVMTATLQANCEKNIMPELYKMCMREICYGGIAAIYESYDDVSGPNRRMDTWSQFINPNLLIMESEAIDPRHWDISLIGRIYYKPIEGIYAQFAKTPSDYAILKEIYANQAVPFKTEKQREMNDQFDEGELVFMRSDDPTRCYVCEVWTRETKARIRLWDKNAGTEEIIDASDYAYRREIKAENQRRRSLAVENGFSEEEIPYIVGDGFGNDEDEKNGFFIDTFWYCRMLAPDGTILWEGESPYADRSHPFTVLVFPFADGKASGYMNDAIDQNLAINRAVVLHDWLLRAQAKGITLVPKALVPDDVSFEEFANSWTEVDGMIFIDVKPGEEGMIPKTFNSAAQTFDVGSLIATYSNLMDKGSPATDAMQGKSPHSGTSGALYAQMTANANLTIAALMESFHKFVEGILNKKLKNIIMFYEPDRFKKIAGSVEGVFDNENLNLNEIQDIEYDMTIKESSNTPVARAVVNQDAKEFLLNNLISFDEYLQIADVPYADKILQGRQARQAEMEAAQGQMAPAPQQSGQQPYIDQAEEALVAPGVKLPQPMV